jgi:hypothetical protein
VDAILIIVGLMALAAFGAGLAMLALYLRSGRGGAGEPLVYGNLAQCPRCQYMNPVDSPVCLNCRLEFKHKRRPVSHPLPYAPPSVAPPPGYTQEPPRPVQATVAAQGQSAPARPPTPAPPVPQAGPSALPPARPAGAMPRAWLDGIAGVAAGQRIPLSQADTLFGRSQVCDAQIYDPKVSRQHFRIRYGNGAFFLQDQESSRGTMINGERVAAQRLNDGDRIDLGDTSLIFRVE